MSFWNKLFNSAAVTLPPPPATTEPTDLSCTLKVWQNERIIPSACDAFRCQRVGRDLMRPAARRISLARWGRPALDCAGSPQVGFYSNRDGTNAVSLRP